MLRAEDVPDVGLRLRVRAFLHAQRECGRLKRFGIWDLPDPEFSKLLGEQGWIGMTWPRRYGGQDATAVERQVVVEELISAGAPVWAHWLADRQVGPLLLKYGTEEQKHLILPRIATGECFICVGISEDVAGSDLAAVRTTAAKGDGVWRINGRKLWTSYAHISHYITIFARTASAGAGARHEGFSQFLVDLSTPGVTMRPIHNLAGRHDLNEVILDDVAVPHGALIGREGQGWSQLTGELVHERAGPERWLTSFPLIRALLDHLGSDPQPSEASVAGSLVASLWTLRQMSTAILAKTENGAVAAADAALLKDLGTTFDQRTPEAVRAVLSETALARYASEEHEELFRHITIHAPSYSLRGGTPEVLRGLVARGLGIR